MMRMNIDDGDIFVGEFTNGALCSIQTSFVTVGNYPGIEARLYGSKGAIICRLVEEAGICETLKAAICRSGRIPGRRRAGSLLPGGWQPRESWRTLFYANLIASFIGEIRGDVEGNEGDFGDGAWIQEVINAVEDSFRERRWVSLPLAANHPSLRVNFIHHRHDRARRLLRQLLPPPARERHVHRHPRSRSSSARLVAGGSRRRTRRNAGAVCTARCDRRCCRHERGRVPRLCAGRFLPGHSARGRREHPLRARQPVAGSRRGDLRRDQPDDASVRRGRRSGGRRRLAPVGGSRVPGRRTTVARAGGARSVAYQDASRVRRCGSPARRLHAALDRGRGDRRRARGEPAVGRTPGTGSRRRVPPLADPRGQIGLGGSLRLWRRPVRFAVEARPLVHPIAIRPARGCARRARRDARPGGRAGQADCGRGLAGGAGTAGRHASVDR